MVPVRLYPLAQLEQADALVQAVHSEGHCVQTPEFT